jgi:hypothetical protein
VSNEKVGVGSGCDGVLKWASWGRYHLSRDGKLDVCTTSILEEEIEPLVVAGHGELDSRQSMRDSVCQAVGPFGRLGRVEML